MARLRTGENAPIIPAGRHARLLRHAEVAVQKGALRDTVALCAWTLLAVLAAALLSGCQSRVGLAIVRSDVGFNDRLR